MNASNSSVLLGEVKHFHSFNNTVKVPRGWMVCNGGIINETNYDAIHGSGAFVSDGVADLLLNGKHTPNLVNRYVTGASATTQSGNSTITAVGNSGNNAALPNHTHQVPAHNHAWYNSREEAAGRTYDSAGAFVNIATATGTTSILAGQPQITGDPRIYRLAVSGATTGTANLYTNNKAAHNTGNNSAATVSVRPDSIQLIPIIRVAV